MVLSTDRSWLPGALGSWSEVRLSGCWHGRSLSRWVCGVGLGQEGGLFWVVGWSWAGANLYTTQICSTVIGSNTDSTGGMDCRGACPLWERRGAVEWARMKGVWHVVCVCGYASPHALLRHLQRILARWVKGGVLAAPPGVSRPVYHERFLVACCSDRDSTRKTRQFVIIVIDKAGLAANCAQFGDPADDRSNCTLPPRGLLAGHTLARLLCEACLLPAVAWHTALETAHNPAALPAPGRDEIQLCRGSSCEGASPTE